MDGTGKSWREIRGELALNETHVDAHRRLGEAAQRLENVRRRQGVDEFALAEILDAVEPVVEARALYVTALSRYVLALGGRLELRAVFGQQAIELPDVA